MQNIFRFRNKLHFERNSKPEPEYQNDGYPDIDDDEAVDIYIEERRKEWREAWDEYINQDE